MSRTKTKSKFQANAMNPNSVEKNNLKKTSSSVAVVMGSKTDLKVMSDALELLKEFKISTHLEVVSAHRTPKRMYEFASEAAQNGLKVIIAGAGGAAHLPGMIAALTQLPVIGVPVNVTKLKGIDALLSVAQMPKGVPVATVAIDNAYNAALLAIQILALSDLGLAMRLNQFKKSQEIKINKMNRDIKKLRSSAHKVY